MARARVSLSRHPVTVSNHGDPYARYGGVDAFVYNSHLVYTAGLEALIRLCASHFVRSPVQRVPPLHADIKPHRLLRTMPGPTFLNWPVPAAPAAPAQDVTGSESRGKGKKVLGKRAKREEDDYVAMRT